MWWTSSPAPTPGPGDVSLYLGNGPLLLLASTCATVMASMAADMNAAETTIRIELNLAMACALLDRRA
jgi:hypothetical protein